MHLPASFFNRVVVLLDRLSDYELDESTVSLCKDIQLQVDDKIAAFVRRQTFSDYVTAPPGDVREYHRKEYLDQAGISHGYRSLKEVPNDRL
jgi:hypothetical protein